MAEFITQTVDGEAAGDWRLIQKAASKYARAKITVKEYSDEIMESEAQRKWLNGVAIPYLAEKWGRSRLWVKIYLKIACGIDLFTAKEVTVENHSFWITSSENDLTVKKCTIWIENILDHKACEDAGLEPPDPEWRRTKLDTPLFSNGKESK